VLPWPWKPQYGQSLAADTQPVHVLLKLKAGADLSKKQAPFIIGRSITIRAKIIQPASDGVIIAQGGASVGYSLYLQDDRLCFATRHDSEMTVISSAEKIGDAYKSLSAKLSKDGTVTLIADEKEVASGHVPGLLRATPNDGLQVGEDKGGAVGDYSAPFSFKGEIGEIEVELSKE
jgi:hypothetical protein